MDKECYWKRTEEIEIDLLDLLRRLCMQWKQIAACALVFAVMAVGFGWIKNRNSADISEPVTAKEAELSETEGQQVADALRLKGEISGLEEYMENSVLMQADPYHKARYIMLYRVDQAKQQELAGITEGFLNYIANGGAAEILAQHSDRWKMDKSYMAERVSAYPKTYSFSSPIVTDGRIDDRESMESLFYVEVTGKNAREAKQLAIDMQKVLEQYCSKWKEKAGSHRLTLLNCMESIVADSGLMSQQNDKRTKLSSDKLNLKAMTDAFTQEQMAVYQDAAGEEDDKEKKHSDGILQENVSENNLKSSIKYMLLGLFAGIFLYSCIYMCGYVFQNKVKSIDEIKERYTFPVYGGICLSGESGNSSRILTKASTGKFAVSGTWQDGYGCTEEQILSRIRIACKKQEVNRLYAVSDFLLGPQEKECLERMAGKLQNMGIDISVEENIYADTELWDKLAETGNVLMVFRMGTTTHQMIDNVMGFYNENGIHVIGAAAFLQNT